MVGGFLGCRGRNLNFAHNDSVNAASISAATYLRRRQSLARRIGEGVIILKSAPLPKKSRDNDYHPYFPERYLYYLTGFNEPDSALLVRIVSGKIHSETLFCRPRNPQNEQWEGARLGVLRASRHLQITAADISTFNTSMEDISRQCHEIYYLPGADTVLDAQLCTIAATRRLQNRKSIGSLRSLSDISHHIDEMRTIKDNEEISLLRQAAKISSDGQRAAMRAAMHVKTEYEIEAALTASFRTANTHHAFSPIVAAGKNACTLHYADNSKRVPANTLILADIGAEWGGYAGDISRTFPQGGKFSTTQAEIYDIVLAAQKRALKAIRPGVRWATVEKTALRVLCQGLAKTGLCQGNVNTIIAKEQYRRFYMHGLGHFIGLDVHDVGRMIEKDGKSRILRAGMILTVEPGLYIPTTADIPSSYRGIGVRIEDTVQITAAGCEILTDAPKTRNQIETWMRG